MIPEPRYGETKRIILCHRKLLESGLFKTSPYQTGKNIHLVQIRHFMTQAEHDLLMELSELTLEAKMVMNVDFLPVTCID